MKIGECDTRNVINRYEFPFLISVTQRIWREKWLVLVSLMLSYCGDDVNMFSIQKAKIHLKPSSLFSVCRFELRCSMKITRDHVFGEVL